VDGLEGRIETIFGPETRPEKMLELEALIGSSI
jgi:hypothetical protein